jgi:hypothetical protein
MEEVNGGFGLEKPLEMFKMLSKMPGKAGKKIVHTMLVWLKFNVEP